MSVYIGDRTFNGVHIETGYDEINSRKEYNKIIERCIEARIIREVKIGNNAAYKEEFYLPGEMYNSTYDDLIKPLFLSLGNPETLYLQIISAVGEESYTPDISMRYYRASDLMAVLDDED